MSLSRFHILFSELMPNVMAFIAVNFVFAFEISLFASVGLYYLGVLPYNHLNWGTMMNQAFQQGSYLTASRGLCRACWYPWGPSPSWPSDSSSSRSALEETFNPRLRRSRAEAASRG